MKNLSWYKISLLGDGTLLIDFGNIIDEKINDNVIHFMQSLDENPIKGTIDLIPAYSSLAIVYDVMQWRNQLKPDETVFSKIKTEVENRITNFVFSNKAKSGIIEIPVCYDTRFGADLQTVAEIKKLTQDEVIEFHISREYHVYMNGFLPGFAYMGETDERIHVSRKIKPVNIISGSVAIAGKQTGIYPLNSPGGWQIIGRTPVDMFIPDQSPPVYLKAGDRVKFYPIPYDEFESYQGRNIR